MERKETREETRERHKALSIKETQGMHTSTFRSDVPKKDDTEDGKEGMRHAQGRVRTFGSMTHIESSFSPRSLRTYIMLAANMTSMVGTSEAVKSVDRYTHLPPTAAESISQ